MKKSAEDSKTAKKKRKNERLNAILYHLNVCMLKDARFLNFRPSQNAAASLLAAMNIVDRPDICKELDIDLS